MVITPPNPPDLSEILAECSFPFSGRQITAVSGGAILFDEDEFNELISQLKARTNENEI